MAALVIVLTVAGASTWKPFQASCHPIHPGKCLLPAAMKQFTVNNM